jgi:8-oxo-dGTP diphosphatase
VKKQTILVSGTIVDVAEVLKIIRDADISSEYPVPRVYEERTSARAIVFGKDGKIALLYATKKNFHKLPGGGVEKDENILTALNRELREEIGYSAKNLREFAVIEEYRNKYALHHTSHCFLADLAGDAGATTMDENEVAVGFVTVWMDLQDAIKTIESETEFESYEWKFIRLRELAFLKEAARITKNV